jgi:hypothetical protein
MLHDASGEAVHSSHIGLRGSRLPRNPSAFHHHRFARRAEKTEVQLDGSNHISAAPEAAPRPDQAVHVAEYAALYAGESAARIHELEGAFEITQQLAAGARAA